MSRSRRRLVAVLTGSVLVLAACGGGSGDSNASEAADLRAQLAELQQELAENANAELQEQLAELEAQIALLEEGSDAPNSTSGSSGSSSSTDGGVTSMNDVPAPVEVSDDGLYSTQEEAERAAEAIGCEGAHQMGDEYMPCGMHGELDEIEAEVEQAPPAEPAPVETATEYAPPADATPEVSSPAVGEIEYSIDQRRINSSQFGVVVDASVPGLGSNTDGISAVCLFQYNEYGNSVHGDPKRLCSNRNGLLATFDPYAKVWKVNGQCGVNNQIKDYYDIGIVSDDGRSVVARVADSSC
jgi:cell division protein FtsB